MPISAYPNGFADGFTLQNTPVQVASPGKIFWVNNSAVVPPNGIAGSNNNPGTFRKPKSTIAGALLQCVANRGDTIYLAPGHAEDIAGAAGIAVSIAGVTIQGIGRGTKQPKITFSATTSTMTVSAADVKISNVHFQATVLSVVKAVVLTAKNFVLDSCLIDNSAASKSFIDFISASGAANSADGLTVLNCSYNSTETTNDSVVKNAAAVDSLTFSDNQITMGVNNNKSVISAATFALTNLRVERNRIYRLNTDSASGSLLVHSSFATCTGTIANNFHGMADTAAEIPSLAAGARFFNNYTTSVDNTSGYLLPVVDS